MQKLIKKYNLLKQKIYRKGFWLFKKNIQNLEKEARKNWSGNESALMRHIISDWFEK